MEEGLFYPSIHMKIHGHNCLFIKNFKQIQTSSLKESIFGRLAFLNGVLKSHLAPAKQDSSSSNTVTTKTSSSTKRKGSVDTFPFPLTRRVIIDMTNAPVNRVMLLMQSQGELIKSGRLKRPYRGFNDCLATIVRNEGIRSLWKGNTARMMSNFVLGSNIKAAMRNSILKACGWDNNKDYINLDKTLANILTAECLSRALIQLVVHPLFYVETRMANDIIIKGSSSNDKRLFNGLTDVLRTALKTDGVAGVYRGFSIGFVASLVNHCLLGAYMYYIDRQTWNSPVNLLAFAMLLFGVPVSIKLSVYPAYTIMGRMMMRSGEICKYKTCFHAFYHIVEKEGFISLYKGASARVIAESISLGIVLKLPSIIGRFESCYSINLRWKKSESESNDGH